MYTAPPKADPELGLTEDDVKPETVHVWPDVWPAVEVFDLMRTQWRAGANGPIGLDYCALPAEASYGTDLFEDVRIMEIEALTAMSEARRG